MRLVDIITIIICFVLLFIVVKIGMDYDKKYQQDLINIASKIDKVVIYNNCYEISNKYVCIKD